MLSASTKTTGKLQRSFRPTRCVRHTVRLSTCSGFPGRFGGTGAFLAVMLVCLRHALDILPRPGYAFPFSCVVLTPQAEEGEA